MENLVQQAGFLKSEKSAVIEVLGCVLASFKVLFTLLLLSWVAVIESLSKISLYPKKVNTFNNIQSPRYFKRELM